MWDILNIEMSRLTSSSCLCWSITLCIIKCVVLNVAMSDTDVLVRLLGLNVGGGGQVVPLLVSESPICKLLYAAT